MISAFCKREFRLEQFGITHHRPDDFTRCQWQRQSAVSVPYLVYRWLLAAYFLGSLAACISETGRGPNAGAQFVRKWPIYLTNWGYVVYTLQAVLAAFLVTSRARRERAKGPRFVEMPRQILNCNQLHVPCGKDLEGVPQMHFTCEASRPLTDTAPRPLDYEAPQEKRPLPVLYKVYWVLHTCSVVLAFGITISYWVAVYDPEYHTLSPFNIMAHAVNSIVMAIDFCLVSHPFRVFHFYWPVLFVAIYLVFSVIYFAFGGTDRHLRLFIYPVLDWQRGVRSTVVAALGLVFVLGLHCVSWALYLLRRGCANTCANHEDKLAKNEFDNSVTYSDSSIQLKVV